jgi:hypothetical protein
LKDVWAILKIFAQSVANRFGYWLRDRDSGKPVVPEV